MSEEINPQEQTPDLGKAETPDLGKAETPDLGKAGNPIKQQEDRLSIIEAKIKELEPRKDEKGVREELSKLYNEKINLTKPPTDFKVAEIWIRSGQIMLDASEAFWADRCRALGVLEFCKDIVKTAQAPKKPNVIVPGNGKFMNYIRGLGKRRR